MSFGAIQFGGIASGLDTAAIIDALLAVEQRSISRLQSRKSEENSKLSLIGSFESLVKGLREKAESLSDGTGYFSHSVTTSVEGNVSATLSGVAQAGVHEIDVTRLAQATRWNTSSFGDASTDLGTGSITFEYQSQTYNVDLTDPDASTIADVADAINDQVGDIVTASLINTGTENNPSYEIVINGLSTGGENEVENVQVSGDLSTSGLSFTQLQSAENAQFTFDGIAIERENNVVSDLLEGWEFTLESAGGGPTTVSAELDTDATIDNLQELVDEYNDVIGFINQQNTYSEEAGAGGELFGDSILSQVRSTIYNSLFDADVDAIAADTTGYASLGLVGFDVGSDGTLSIDRTEMAEKLTEDGAAFTNLLTGDTDFGGETVAGAFGKLVAGIESIVEGQNNDDGDPIGSLFQNRKDSINDRIDAFDDQIDREQYRIEKVEENLVARFSALESLLAGLQSQQAFLNG